MRAWCCAASATAPRARAAPRHAAAADPRSACCAPSPLTARCSASIVGTLFSLLHKGLHHLRRHRPHLLLHLLEEDSQLSNGTLLPTVCGTTNLFLLLKLGNLLLSSFGVIDIQQ